MMVANRQLVKHDSLKNLIPSVPLLLLPPPLFFLKDPEDQNCSESSFAMKYNKYNNNQPAVGYIVS
jgi:hypothetical protein